MDQPRSLLVQLDGTDDAPARLAVARGLARRWPAEVAAMFVAEPPERGSSLEISDTPAQFVATREAAALARARAALEDCRADGCAARWLDAASDGDCDDAASFARQAAYADLVLMGAPGAPHGGTPAGLVESVLIGSGRPGLVLPHGWSGDVPGNRVLVAWDAGAPAVHALASAWPWLRAAQSVWVVDGSTNCSTHGSAGGSAGGSANGDTPPIVAHLAAHGVAAWRVEPPAGPGADLQRIALSLGADLLVMGCYGHGRLYELAFGGASREALGHTRLPLLMAH